MAHEIDDSEKRGRSLIRTIYTGTIALRTVVTDAARARTIAAIVARHGFSQLLALRRTSAKGIQDEARKEILGGEGNPTAGLDKDDLAARVVAMLEDLGPTFIKFGQIMSTRPDIIPPSFAEGLQKLQDRVVPVDAAEVRRAIAASLGDSVDTLFASFDNKQLASASIAQVHAATLKDGTEVILKVQRPGLRPIIEADLSLLRFLVAQVLDIFPEAEGFDLGGMITEFETSLRRELDFDVERQNLERFRINFRDNPHLHFPTVYEQFSTKTVLCMERLRGSKITAIQDEAQRETLAKNYLDAAYQMIFKDGFIHGDLHPGNLFVENDGRVGVIDFGMVARLSKKNRERIVDMLWALQSEDLETVARIWYAIGKPKRAINYAVYEADAIELMEQHIVGKDVDKWNVAGFFTDLASGAIRHGLRLPADFTMLFKAMVTTEGLARGLAKGINPIEAARPYVEVILKERYGLDRIKHKAFVDGVRVIDQLWSLPSTIERLTEKIDQGDLRLRIRHEHLDDNAKTIGNAINRAGLAIISAAGAVTGAIAMGKGQDVLWGLSPLSLVAFFIAFSSTMLFFASMLRGR